MYGWSPYVPVAARRAKAERELRKLAKKGQETSPVVIEGRTIAHTFWGKSWCANLERYSDYANRLPRGRTYVRNGSILDLQVRPGRVEAMVSGSEIYRITIGIKPLPATRWDAIREDCAGAIDSLVELLQGRFSKGVMERICREGTGLFPSPSEIQLDCSCPDWADMCKHVAAVLYGIGARLDTQPELLFRLRGVDEQELIAKAAAGLPLVQLESSSDRILAGDDLGDLFGLDLAGGHAAPPEPGKSAKPGKKALPAKGKNRKTAPGNPTVKKPGTQKTVAKKPAVDSRKAAKPPAKHKVSAAPPKAKTPVKSPAKTVEASNPKKRTTKTVLASASTKAKPKPKKPPARRKGVLE